MLSKKLPYWNKAITHLKQNDKILAKIISSHHKDYLIINNQYFISLIKAIIGQQISVKAAQSIWIRFSRKYRPITVKKISKEKINSLKKIYKFKIIEDASHCFFIVLPDSLPIFIH